MVWPHRRVDFGPTSLFRAQGAVEARLRGRLVRQARGRDVLVERGDIAGACCPARSAQAEAAEERDQLTPIRIRGRSNRPSLASDDAADLMLAEEVEISASR